MSDLVRYLDEMAVALREAGVEVGPGEGREAFRRKVAERLLAADGLVAHMVAEARSTERRDIAYDLIANKDLQTAVIARMQTLYGSVRRERAIEVLWALNGALGERAS